MTLKELADRIESLDEDAFASILGFEYSHDDELGQAKKMIVEALRFSDQNGLRLPPTSLDEAD
jgi:hypothetical protein